MIRRIAFGKAILAGVIGAVAWEAVITLLILAKLPLLDLAHLLGTIIWDGSPAYIWWPTGLLIHAVFGAIWAIFYVYFFWSDFHWKPIVQGISFAVIPLLVAGIVMVPQVGLMNPLCLQGKLPQPGIFAIGYGWGGPVALIIGHIIYGLSLGTIYVRPVGYPTGHPERSPLRAK